MARALCAVAPVLGAIVLIHFGRYEPLGFDSVWHVFIARQQDWFQFWFEVADNAHPPLFYLVLKVATWLGRSPLVYRLPSMAAIAIAAALMGRLAARLVKDRWLSGMAALAFALSYSAVHVGLEVRANALATCLTLAGLLSYLTLAESAFAQRDIKSRTLFTSLITLALLTHYSVAYVVVAAVVSPFLLAAVNREYRTWLEGAWRGARRANLLTFGGPLALFALVYVVHGRRWVHRIQHLPEFMFDPGREGIIAFSGRTMRAEIELFMPVPLSGVVVWAAATTVTVAVFALFAVRRTRPQAEARQVAVLFPVMLLVMAGLLLASAIVGRYPFGGPVRHQFFLLPIAILSLIVVVNWIGQRLPTGWPRLALIAAVAACSAASVTGWMVTWSATPGLMHQPYMDAFSAEFPGVRAVYVDHFSIVPFFLHHHQWDWWLERPVGSPAQFRVWKVSSGGQEIRVCRDRSAWRLDIIDAGFYSNLGRCLQATGAPNVALFQIRPRGLPPGMGREEVYALMERLAMGAGLRSVSIAIGPSSVFGLFERASAS